MTSDFQRVIMKLPEYPIFETRRTLVGEEHLNNENREGKKEGGKHSGSSCRLSQLYNDYRLHCFIWGIFHQLRDYPAHFDVKSSQRE